MSFQNDVEEAVFNLCRKSFLSLWSYANPRRHGSTKELCDVLVVCEPDIVLISVKNYELGSHAQPEVAAKRWFKKALDESVKQLYGSKRNLRDASFVTRHDGSRGIDLPKLEDRVVHSVSISLGSRGQLPIPAADFGKGFVHVVEERFLEVLMSELDTISDFVGYLRAKESLLGKFPGLIVDGGEENLLAVFLTHAREFPDEPPPPVIPGEILRDLRCSRQYRLKVEEDQVSYAWDSIVEWLSEQVLEDRMEFSNSLSQDERILRFLARENRFSRRVLVNALKEFRALAEEQDVRARLVTSPYGVAYVFYNPPANMSRKDRIAELGLRCFVARDRVDYQGCNTVIGIGTNIQPAEKGFATDLFMVSTSEWTEENRRKAEGIRRDLGYFENPREQRVRVDEYPTS